MLLLSRARGWALGRALPRAAGCGLVACSLAAVTAPALAQDNGLAQQFEDFRSAVGLGKERPSVDFSERPPLAVPPTYALPPPVAVSPSLPVKDPDVEARRKALVDARRPVPPTDPGAHAAGLGARTYLIDPPAGFRDPKAVSDSIEVDTSPTNAASKPARKRRAHKAKAAAAKPVAAAQ